MVISKRVQNIRSSFLSGDLKRDADKVAPDDVLAIWDIPYGTDTVTQLLDIYLPKTRPEKLPVIVSVHGGGWVYGSKAIYKFYCLDLARRGFAVVNYTYRLAPENKYPAALEDTNLVFEWIIANQEKYGLDTKNIFAVGDSAGGNYLGLYASFVTNPEFASRFDFQVPKDLSLRGIALNCGYYDGLGRLTGETDSLLYEVLEENGKYTLKDLDVLTWITKDFPQTFLMTSNKDFLREQAPLIEKEFQARNVPYVFKSYGDDEHELWHVFHVNVVTNESKECNDEECAFFKKLMI